MAKPKEYHMTVPYQLVITEEQHGPNVQYSGDWVEFDEAGWHVPTAVSNQSREDCIEKALHQKEVHIDKYLAAGKEPPLPYVARE